MFFNTMITQNDHPRYVKHVLANIYVIFSLFCVCVAWGRFSARWTCRTPYDFAKHFVDIVTTYNDEICYVKHVLDPLSVFFNPFWGVFLGGAGGSQGV